MQHDKRIPPVHRQKGFSMIELLVAVLIISVGLLGIAGLQMYSLKNNHVSYLRSQATLMAYDIVDRMRANRDSAIAGNYTIAMSADAPGTGSIASTDLTQWLTNLGQSLPAGDGSVALGANGQVTVTVKWVDDRNAETPTEQNFQVVTRI